MMPTASQGTVKSFGSSSGRKLPLHKAAKAAFDEAGLQKLPKVKALDAEFAELLTRRSSLPDYRKARNEMQELMKAQKNVEMFFAEEKVPKDKSADPINREHRGFFPFLGESSVFFFRYRSIWRKCAACIQRMQYTKGLGLSQQAFAEQKWRLYIRTPCLQVLIGNVMLLILSLDIQSITA